MRLKEFASAEDQMALWRLIDQSVWDAIDKQAREEAQRKAVEQARKSVRLRKAAKSKPRSSPPKKTASPSPAVPEVPTDQVKQGLPAQTAAKGQLPLPQRAGQGSQPAPPAGPLPTRGMPQAAKPAAAPAGVALNATPHAPMTRQTGRTQVAQKHRPTTNLPVL